MRRDLGILTGHPGYSFHCLRVSLDDRATKFFPVAETEALFGLETEISVLIALVVSVPVGFSVPVFGASGGGLSPVSGDVSNRSSGGLDVVWGLDDSPSVLDASRGTSLSLRKSSSSMPCTSLRRATPAWIASNLSLGIDPSTNQSLGQVSGSRGSSRPTQSEQAWSF